MRFPLYCLPAVVSFRSSPGRILQHSFDQGLELVSQSPADRAVANALPNTQFHRGSDYILDLGYIMVLHRNVDLILIIEQQDRGMGMFMSCRPAQGTSGVSSCCSFPVNHRRYFFAITLSTRPQGFSALARSFLPAINSRVLVY